MAKRNVRIPCVCLRNGEVFCAGMLCPGELARHGRGGSGRNWITVAEYVERCQRDGDGDGDGAPRHMVAESDSVLDAIHDVVRGTRRADCCATTGGVLFVRLLGEVAAMGGIFSDVTPASPGVFLYFPEARVHVVMDASGLRSNEFFVEVCDEY